MFKLTEIDEILTLRILAMTDEEKREMAAADERGRALLERTEALTAADMARLHGTLRDPRLCSISNGASAADPWRPVDMKPELAFLRVHGTDLAWQGDAMGFGTRGEDCRAVGSLGMSKSFDIPVGDQLPRIC